MKDSVALDWKLRLSFSPDTELSNGSRKYRITSEMGIYVDDEETEISIFFPDDPKMNRELFIFLNSMDAVKKNNIWRISRKMDVSTEFRELMIELVGTPSAVLSSAWLENGVYRVELIFSRVKIDNISSILLKKLDRIPEVRIEYLGPSGGIKETLEEIGIRSSVSVLEYDFTIDPIKFPVQIDSLGNSWFRIIKSPYESRTVSAVYIVREGQILGRNMKEIVRGRLYEASVHNPLFTDISNNLRKKRIPVMLKMHSLNNGIMRYYIIHPSIFTSELLEILGETGLMEMGLNPVIRRIQSIQEWLESCNEFQEIGS